VARIRTIKPEFWKHEDLSELPEATHMLAAALLNHADDEGYFNANPALVRAECCPLREPSVSVHDSLISLAKIGYLQLGAGTDGKRYGRIVKFDDHQRVNRPTPSKIKDLVAVWEDSPRTHPQLSEHSPPERKGKEGKGTGNGKETLPGVESTGVDPEPVLTLVDKKPSEDERVVAIVLDAYHRTLPDCRRLEVLTPKRRKRVLAANKLARNLCKTNGWQLTVREFWLHYFGQCALDPWLRGEVPNPNNPRWKQNLEVLISEDRFAEIMDRAIAAANAEPDAEAA
jgi:hypothetical protein